MSFPLGLRAQGVFPGGFSGRSENGTSESAAQQRCIGLRPGHCHLGHAYDGEVSSQEQLREDRRRRLPTRVSRKKVLRRSDQWPLDRFSVIQPEWIGQTVVCIAGGPSLANERGPDGAIARVASARADDRCRVITINNSYELAPWADIHYFADARWWKWHKDKEGFKAFKGVRCSIENTGLDVDDAEVHLLRNAATLPRPPKFLQGDGINLGLSPDNVSLRTGLNSGYQAIGLAVAAGAARIILLGYDMRFSEGKSHWHGDHPLQDDERNYLHYAEKYNSIKTDVQILNATKGSAITAFPFVSLEEALP